MKNYIIFLKIDMIYHLDSYLSPIDRLVIHINNIE